jgi:hypothetical protein
MSKKSFDQPPVRPTRDIEKKSAADPAYAAAAAAFPIEPEPEPEPDSRATLPAEPAALHASAATPVTTCPPTSATTDTTGVPAAGAPTVAAMLAAQANVTQPPVRPSSSSKMTIYPGPSERRRLATLRYEHQIAESIIVEYALELLLAGHTDDQIVSVLRSRGHGLRRARAG